MRDKRKECQIQNSLYLVFGAASCQFNYNKIIANLKKKTKLLLKCGRCEKKVKIWPKGCLRSIPLSLLESVDIVSGWYSRG